MSGSSWIAFSMSEVESEFKPSWHQGFLSINYIKLPFTHYFKRFDYAERSVRRKIIKNWITPCELWIIYSWRLNRFTHLRAMRYRGKRHYLEEEQAPLLTSFASVDKPLDPLWTSFSSFKKFAYNICVLQDCCEELEL